MKSVFVKRRRHGGTKRPRDGMKLMRWLGLRQRISCENAIRTHGKYQNLGEKHQANSSLEFSGRA